ncbi:MULTISPECIES: hypothetical protein [Paenarthrobacter]|uniref:hypothetical protein n=1 Tax=Paenarthrobacter TaxID=1742992 RepID=UPI00074D3C6C|nr:hypothetical protein [Paenarthrobacter ureafaciens]AMB39486.1 hypothetical protein AUT26_04120 [Arthrobacter sp. ATCC 21022]KUR64649.1 hypothetical protein JM67_09995 [Arthrobacter sp. ATCC 21022]RWW95716.1 hypothetical protein AUR_14665 [Paenarthrobacter ureafaciens]
MASLEIWTGILDRFEADIALAVSGGFPPAWEPPLDAGPLPAELAPQARRVLEAQADAMDLLARMKHDAGTQLGALAAVPAGPVFERPLLLDIRG